VKMHVLEIQRDLLKILKTGGVIKKGTTAG
jgi:hypothetical protein